MLKATNELPDNLVVDAVDDSGSDDNQIVLFPCHAFTDHFHHVHHVTGSALATQCFTDNTSNAGRMSAVRIVGNKGVCHGVSPIRESTKKQRPILSAKKQKISSVKRGIFAATQ